MQITLNILTLLFIVVSVALVLIVLVQRPQGGGLTSAFGGGGGTDTAFGGRTGDALTVATITAFTVYLLLAIGLNITSNTIRNAPAAEPAANTATAPADGTAPSPAPGATPPAEPNKPMLLTPDEAKKLLGDTQTAPAPASATTTPAPAGQPQPEPVKLPDSVTPLPGGTPSTVDPSAPKPGVK